MGRWAVAGLQPHCSLVQSGGAAHSSELPLPTPDGACEAERMEEPITACSPGRRVAMQAFPKASLHRFPKVFQARRRVRGLAPLQFGKPHTANCHSCGDRPSSSWWEVSCTTSNLSFNPRLTAQPEVLQTVDIFLPWPMRTRIHFCPSEPWFSFRAIWLPGDTGNV